MAAREDKPDRPEPLAVTAVPRVLVAEQLVRAEWAKAENRAACAPLAFASVGTEGWSARPATFAGGWAVAFDLPQVRSAFGIAGTGYMPEDRAPGGDSTDQDARSALQAQWPFFRDLPALPQPAYAGYGRESGEAYPQDNPHGFWVNSLAYVRVGGQACLYNVWSRLGRAHLELLIDQLRLMQPE